MNNEEIRILIIDDEKDIVASIKDILEDEGYLIQSALSVEEARAMRSKYDFNLILLDIWMPGTIDGITLLREWQIESHYPLVIMMSGHASIENAITATRFGAYDFLEKPLSSSKLVFTVNNAINVQKLKQENSILKSRIDPPLEIIGKSKHNKELREKAERFASQNSPVLICGQSGVGKQHIARYIHKNSARGNQKFINVALSTMEEQEVIPRLRGEAGRAGLIAQSHHGTLFFDEISSLNFQAQKIVSDLIGKRYYYGGGDQIVDCRVIAASRLPINIIKEQLIAELYDQINIVFIDIQPLEKHAEDVPELLEYFSQYFADNEQMSYRHFSSEAQNFLRQHHWSGNIRELRNLVQRLLIQSDKPEISLDEVRKSQTPPESKENDILWSKLIPKDLSLREAREIFERQYLLEQFRHCNGNIAKLAGRVGMDRTNLYRKLRSLRINPTQKNRD